MSKQRKISKRFQPDECSYKIGWIEVFEKPKGAEVKYWLRDIHGNYFGILRFRVNLIQTIMLLVILYAIYAFFFNLGNNVIKVTSSNVLYMHNGKLAVNMNSDYKEGEPVEYKIVCKGTVLQSGTLQPGSSVGTVRTRISMPVGDYPAVITYSTSGEHKIVTKEVNILIKVQ